MKKSKYQKWFNKKFTPVSSSSINSTKSAWNGACKSILVSIRRRHKELEGNWRHEDVEFLMEDIEDMIEK